MEPEAASQVESGALSGAFRSRIVGSGEPSPEELLANPRNWRIHPQRQRQALEGVLEDVGWVQQVIVNQRTGHVVDGHLRVALALSREEPTVPVLYVDLTEDEERRMLAVIDPLGAMAVTDEGALKGLLADLEGDLAGALGEVTRDLANASPSGVPGDPSQDRIDRTDQEMRDRFDGGGRDDLYPVTCPGCGEDFHIERPRG